MKLSLIQSLTVAAIAVLGAAGSAQAAQHTLVGANFDVTYDDTQLGLFGAPTLSANSLFFTFNNFEAASENGAGLIAKQSAITGLVLTAKNGFQFGSLQLVETGVYEVQGSGDYVDVEGQFTAFDVANPIATITADGLAISPATPLTIVGAGLKSWLGGALIDSSTLALPGMTNLFLLSPTRIGLTIDNTLTAYTDPNGTGPRSAYVSKNFAGVGVTVSPIPEPATSALLAAGLGVLVLLSSRRSS